MRQDRGTNTYPILTAYLFPLQSFKKDTHVAYLELEVKPTTIFLVYNLPSTLHTQKAPRKDDVYNLNKEYHSGPSHQV